MSIHCKTCGNYIYKGTKFNSCKEDVINENYLGLSIVRIYFKYRNCSPEIIYEIDLKNSDYTVEYGATQEFEPWRGIVEDKEKKELGLI